MKFLKSKITDAVSEETGIDLKDKDLEIVKDGSGIILALWDNHLFECEIQDDSVLEDDEFAEELIDSLFDEYYDLREKIIELKLQNINSKYISPISEKFIEKLKERKVARGLLDILDFEFVNGDEDETWGYPPINLRITDFEKLEHNCHIDITKEPIVVDYDAVTKELLTKI